MCLLAGFYKSRHRCKMDANLFPINNFFNNSLQNFVNNMYSINNQPYILFY